MPPSVSPPPAGPVSEIAEFEGVVEADRYRAAADDDIVGVSDVVGSTEAIAAGRYKAVNFAGAAVIGAVMNGVARRDFPFAFGGDGASFLLRAGEREAARTALQNVAQWSDRELKLKLRVGLVDVAAIRAAGRDVKFAWFKASQSVAYAMFAGGGIAYAESELKAGRIGLTAAAAPGEPDLTGLSCRFRPLAARHGLILSLIVRPRSRDLDPAFQRATRRLIALIAEREAGAGTPLPEGGPVMKLFGSSARLEAHTLSSRNPYALRWLAAMARQAWIGAVIASGIKVAGFDADHYRRQSARNSDFRKYGDGLAMTIDCSPATADAIEALLAEERRAGALDFGAHRQTEALVTCLVPSAMTDDHFHFVDGAGGGYALAAKALKQSLVGQA